MSLSPLYVCTTLDPERYDYMIPYRKTAPQTVSLKLPWY